MISAKERKEKTIAKLKEMGIATIDVLPEVEDSSQVKLKSLDEICARAIATLLSTQVACDINNNNYEESKKYFDVLLDTFNVRDKLNSKEKKLFDGTYTDQDAIDVVWTYESYWALCYALGLIDSIEDASNICDTNLAISFVSKSKDFEDFKSKCKLRDIEEILDMLDLYYRYHWATTDNRMNPDTPIGNLNDEIVVERRRGLEWLFIDKDWFDIPLDT